MELHHHHPFRVLLTHHGVGQPLGRVGFAHARSALQYDVLLLSDQAHQRFIAGFVHIDIFQEVFRSIRWIQYYRRDRIDLIAIIDQGINEQAIQLFNVIRIRRDIRHRFHGSLPRVRPRPFMCPFHASYILIAFPRRIKSIIRCYNAFSNDSVHPFFGENYVARLHFVGELPRCMCGHLPR